MTASAQNHTMLQSTPRAPTGFSLVELMVVLLVVGILAAVAYPAYTSHVQRSRRGDAVAVLSAVVQAQERYRTNRVEYAHDLSALGITATSITNHYTVEITGIGSPATFTTGYVATASAVSTSPQNADAKCATLAVRLDGSTLSYTSTDAAGNDSSSSCWPR